jgi:outer membrane protein assembly factor BamB
MVCRDAFNGTLLWRRPIGPWGWPQWAANKFQDKDWTTITGGRTVVPNENQRRLVVDGDRLYATLGYEAPLAILDAATGKTLTTVAETAPVREIVSADGVVVVYSQVAEREPAQPKGKAQAAAAGVVTAVNGATGVVQWQKKTPQPKNLSLAVDRGRVVYRLAKALVCLDLQSGKELWRVEPLVASARTLVAHEGVVVLVDRTRLEARDGTTGKQLWQKEITPGMGLGTDDLFVIAGVVWPGIVAAKGGSATAVGYDLRTGEERKRVAVPDLLSPEHHHRCYRNKATDRYLIGAMEGTEFLDLQGTNHRQNNFVRGACKLGIMPCNGMLYVPADQCFCEPGAKLLGFKALTPAPAAPLKPVPGDQRLERGPAYTEIQNPKHENGNQGDWPTYRHDAARHGSTPGTVGDAVTESWRTKLGGSLTAPVAVGEQAFVAARDTHTLHALNLRTGQTLWTFTAGGRVDSPPTVHRGVVLFGSADGFVYCLRSDDGALAWRFLAAPCERRIVCDGQLESAWPVHGSVLVRDGIAYVAAGRSTYLDGGIRLYGLNPLTGKILHQGVLSGPFPNGKD